jgi:hypothetical protein
VFPKITINDLAGFFTGEGTALHQRRRCRGRAVGAARRSASDAATDRRRERSLDADEYLLKASTVSSGSQLLNCVLFAGEDLHPGDLLLAAAAATAASSTRTLER